MTAKEARTLSQVTEETETINLDDIFEEIKKQAINGERNYSFWGILTQQQWNKFYELGYDITSERIVSSGPDRDKKYTISW